ncbi:hypothetical protein J6590_040120 [Homalodisca vitripennis]|nr:hypothetical protein J6590_040120 [Homalodisca vitripennis]
MGLTWTTSRTTKTKFAASRKVEVKRGSEQLGAQTTDREDQEGGLWRHDAEVFQTTSCDHTFQATPSQQVTQLYTLNSLPR